MSTMLLSVVGPILGAMAYMASNPAKASQGGSYEDKPIWSTWIENVVKAFNVGRSEDDPRSSRQVESSNAEAGKRNDRNDSGNQPPVQPPPQPVYPFLTHDHLSPQSLGSIIKSASSRIAPQDRQYNPDVNPGTDIMHILPHYFRRMAHMSQQPVDPYQAYPDGRATYTDTRSVYDRNAERMVDLDPDLSERRRRPVANEKRARKQAYDSLSPVLTRGASEGGMGDRSATRDRRYQPDHSEPPSQLADPEYTARSKRQDYSDRPNSPSSRVGGTSARDVSQAEKYLDGRYHTRDRDDPRRRSPDRDFGRGDARSRREDRGYERAYDQESREDARNRHYPDQRPSQGRERSTGRRDRSYYDDSRTGRRHEEGYDEHDSYGRVSKRERRERRERGRRAESEDMDEESRDRGYTGRHRDDFRKHSHTEEDRRHSPQGGNNTNVVVNVGELAPPDPQNAGPPPPAAAPVADQNPVPLQVVSPVKDQVPHIPAIDSEPPELHGEEQERQKRHEKSRRYERAMEGPPKRTNRPKSGQRSSGSGETANRDESLPVAADTADDLASNTTRRRTGAPVPAKDVGSNVDKPTLADPVRTSETDHESRDDPDPRKLDLESNSHSRIPLETTFDPTQSPNTATPLRGAGARRKPKLDPIKTDPEMQNQMNGMNSPVRRNNMLENSPEQRGDTDRRRSRETSPIALSNRKDPYTPSHSDLGKADTAPRRPKSQHSRKSSSVAPTQHRVSQEGRDTGLSDRSLVRSPIQDTTSQSAVRQNQEVQDYGDSDTDNPRIGEPKETVADKAAPRKPRRARRRQQVAREVLQHSSTFKIHNVRGPKSFARLIKLALKSSPKVTFLTAVVGIAYISGIIYFGNQVTALEQLTSASTQPTRRGPVEHIGTSSTFSPLENFEKDTQLLIILNLWHAGIWLVLLFLIDYIWRSIPNPNHDQKHQIWFDRLGFKSLVRVMFTFAPMAVYLFLGGRQLTSCAYLLNDPQAIAWSMWPDVALTWTQLSNAAITRTTEGSADGVMTDDVDGWQLLAVSAFFWGTGIPTLLYTIRRIRHPGMRSKRRLLTKIQKKSKEYV